jgi:hypothetical protein
MALYIRPWRCSCGGFRNRLHSIGARLIETKPETRMATPMVTANSFSSRPTMPPMNRTGMNTATSDAVIATMVNEISFEPSSAACIGDLPISMCRTMFSSITIASSTTKPTERVSAIKDRLSRL